MVVLSLLKRILGRPRQDEDPVARGKRAIEEMRSGSAATSGWFATGSCDGRDLGGLDGGGGGSDGGC